MKKGEDFRREFPVVDEGFSRAAYIALADLTEVRKGYGMPMPKLAMILVAAVILLSSVAVAATVHRLNIQDFTDRSDKANLTEEARRILATDFLDVIIDNPYADMVVTEAVYDGMAVYVLVQVKPVNEDAFIIPSHLFENNQAFSYGSSYPTDMSIQQYAEQLGYQDVIAMQGTFKETSGQYYDSALNEDGSFSLMLWGLVRPEYRDLPELKINMTTNMEKNGRWFDEQEAVFSIPRAGKTVTANSKEGEAVIFENAGVCVKEIKVIRTPMSTYIIADYDIVNRAAYRKYITYRQFRLLDEDGQELPKGAYPLSMRFDESYQRMGNQPFYITNRIFDKMPTQLTIGEYDGNREDGWTDGKTYTFHLE